jgi:hypothetical protein
MQLSLFDDTTQEQPNLPSFENKQLLYDLFQAYYDARRNKRNTISALQFEQNYESNLLELYEEIINRKYKIKPSVCFINYHPVQREIFAADFRDRIVHHLVYNYISPIFERIFINDSYSCRKGKGTSYGVNRLKYIIRACSNNYQNDCYILQLDIKGYFMAINRNLLYKKTISVLNKFQYKTVKQASSKRKKWNDFFDFDIVFYLLKLIIFNNPVNNHIRKGNKKDWYGLPPSKSLFYSKQDCGLPIGNLTSQLFSNIYLNDFDSWIKHKLQFKYYGRYVDDFVIVHKNKEFLKRLIPKIRNYLQENLQLELHPKKIYLQHYLKGVEFLCAIIKPHRIYLKNRTKGSFYTTLQKWNNYIENKPILTKQEIEKFVSSINSYHGISLQYNTFKLRKKMILKNMSVQFWDYVYFSDYKKLKIKKTGHSTQQ